MPTAHSGGHHYQWMVSMRNRMLSGVVLGVILLLSVMTSSATASASSAPPPSASIGLNGPSRLLGSSDAQVAAGLDAVRNAGAGWVRLDVDWSAIEPTRGVQNWSATDRVVNAARSRGLRVLAIATYTPRWAQDASVPAGTTHGRPASAAQFGAFAGQAAGHFAGRIDSWEIWNEPNNTPFFAPRTDASFYTAMLTASYSAIHGAVPSATVIGGALSPNVGTDAPAAYLQQMYGAGAKGFLDAVSTHPYTYPNAMPSGTESWNPYFQTGAVHDVMTSNGDGAKKIWFTEFGAPTGPGAKAVSEQKQAAIIADGLTLARSWSFVGPLFLYETQDANTGSTDVEENFGLLRTDGSAKPAYDTVRRQATADGGGTPATPPATPTPTPAPPPSGLDALWALLWSIIAAWFH